MRIGGLVVARQRPGTASGIVFVLLEDEFGTINLIVPPQIYERHRLAVRTEPLMLVEGKLEKLAEAGGAINVLVDRVGSIDAPDLIAPRSRTSPCSTSRSGAGWPSSRPPRPRRGRSGPAGRDGGGGDAEEFRAVAPPIMSFASGRRR